MKKVRFFDRTPQQVRKMVYAMYTEKFMSTLRQASVCSALLTASLHAAAQTSELPELLRPVDAAITARLTGPAYTALRKQLYFAKQYRVVTIDWSLLEQPDAAFRIELFDGVSNDVHAKDVASARSDEYVRRWVGEITDVVPSSVRPLYEGDPGLKRSLERYSTLELSIRASTTLDVSPQLQQQLVAERSTLSATSTTPPGARGLPNGQPGKARISVPTVRGRWIVPALRAQLVLMVIEADPRYHLLYAEDPQKLPFGPNAQSRRAQFAQFSAQVDREARQSQPHRRQPAQAEHQQDEH